MNPPSNENAKSKTGATSSLYGMWNKVVEQMDRHIPPELEADPETHRHARLISRFAILGTIAGSAFTIFYLLIGHYLGAFIVFTCTTGVFITPAVMRWKKSVSLAGNFFAWTLIVGFLGLCFVEGGLHGHAIAWLVSVPLCALLLLGRSEGIQWVIISFLAAALVAGLDLAGIDLPTTYDPKWNSIISTAGYMGLLLFMFFLGLAFENGRVRAHAKMQQALKALATSNQELVYLNKEKNEFLGIAAHDLRNPLSVILGNAELLRILNNPEETEKLSGLIIISAERMRGLINNLLDVNMIEEGKFASNIESCDMAALTRECVEHNHASAWQKQIKIEMQATNGIYAASDKLATAQVLDNLVSNAIKYSFRHTSVHIRLYTEGKYSIVSVRDEGPGISPDDQTRLFQKFSRLSARPTGGESSTGLGLAIAKRLAEAMSGSVECESTLNAGTTFKLRLPLFVGSVPIKMAANATASARLRWQASGQRD